VEAAHKIRRIYTTPGRNLLAITNANTAWVGMGAVGTAAVGMALFHEPTSFARLACVGLVVMGIVGLPLQGGH
jgi:quaternary ammonium compound-resistance protein SugE